VEKVGLCYHYGDDKHLSISRIKCGKKRFYYRYASGRKVNSKRVLNRIKGLAVPPNWQDTKISKDSKASIQAIGIDEKGRKQYIYHQRWHEHQQAVKFSRLLEFGKQLPQFRQRCLELVEKEAWNYERACALVCLLLDYTGARVGNVQYSKQNNTFGLTTLRRKHLQNFCEDGVALSYIGKHGKTRNLSIDDPELAKLICESAQQQGYSLFRYKDESSRWHDITSEDVNAFIHDNMSEDFSCKDFRTWAASRFALMCLGDTYREIQESTNKKWQSTLSKRVAAEIGNTPSVCRQYYIHPKLLCLDDAPQQLQDTLSKIDSFSLDAEYNLEVLSPVEKVLMDIVSPQ